MTETIRRTVFMVLLLVCPSVLLSQTVNVVTRTNASEQELYAAEYLEKKLNTLGYKVQGDGFQVVLELADEPPVLAYGAAGFLERASSTDWRGAARLVSSARAWIDAHARDGRPIRAADVAAALNVSVRLLHLRFRETGGGTLREAVEEARLAAVRERLRTSDAPVDAVATECGFASVSHLAAAFRRRFGLTMARWRARHRAGAR